MEFVASNPNPLKDERSYMKLSHHHVAVEWIIPEDGCL